MQSFKENTEFYPIIMRDLVSNTVLICANFSIDIFISIL
jgi:hypothetical protein